MEFLQKKIQEQLGDQLNLLTISAPRHAAEIKKYGIRPVLVRGQLLFQQTAYTKTQVFHKNLTEEELMAELRKLLPAYRQVQLTSATVDLTAMINKKGKAAIKVKKKETAAARCDRSRLAHNRTKRYILPEGQAVPFLLDLGVMTEEGKIVRAKYDKYRQINRFLEFIEDILPKLPKDREVTILDFGCGKSYLTFAMYYYLRELRAYDVRIIGLDLKRDVIRNCQKLAVKYGYEKLSFYEGSIEAFEGVEQVDMVVTLHACDTATDYALAKAVRWGASVILSVPCCQHELNGQIATEGFAPVADYGILKERFCALATDGIRAKLLESVGYETQILEFIDMEHTPKNLLLRAVRRGKEAERQREAARRQVEAFCADFGFSPTLFRLLEKKGEEDDE